MQTATFSTRNMNVHQLVHVSTIIFLGIQCLLDQRQNLKFLVAEGQSPIDCWRRLSAVYGEETMSKPMVRQWHKTFENGDGHTPVSDLPRCGRPPVQTSQDKVNEVDQMLQGNQRLSLRSVAKAAQISVTSVHRVVRKKLDLRLKSAKFVPKILSQEQKENRVEACQENLQQLRDDEHLLDKLVCGDESPVWILDPEGKHDSMQWLPKDAPHPVKALRQHLQKKSMLTVFFDARGVIFIEFSEGRIKAKHCVKTLKHLREKIRQKRPFLWKGGSMGRPTANSSCKTIMPVFTLLMRLRCSCRQCRLMC